MIRLLRVELRRLGSRRLVRLLAALLLLALGATVVINAAKSNGDVAGARARAARQATRVGPPESAIEQCESDARANGISTAEAHCRPTAADFYVDPRLIYRQKAVTYLNGGVGLGIAFAVIVAVAGIGAEWSAGTFASLLLWEPRRRRVLAAKLAAVTLLGSVATAVMALAFLGGAWVIAATRGSLAGAVGSATHRALLGGGRGVVAAALLALIMGSVAVVVRSTAGALGLVAVYTVAIENVLRALRPSLARWELGTNVVALISGHYQLANQTPGAVSGAVTSRSSFFTLSAGRAVSYLLIFVLIAVAAAAVFLQRQDVT